MAIDIKRPETEELARRGGESFIDAITNSLPERFVIRIGAACAIRSSKGIPREGLYDARGLPQ
jgi:hypothetical protein